MRRSNIALGLGLLLVFAAVGIASATSEHRTVTAKKAHGARISVFHHPFHPTRAQRAQRAEIRREFRHTPPDSAVASAAYDSARTVTIPGTDTDVWIAPDENGGACTFIADPLGGYGSSCATANAIANGQAATMLIVGDGTSLAGKALVALVAPDGAAAPLVRSANGTTRELPIDGNLATGLLEPGDVIESNSNDIVVPKPRHHECAPPAAGEAFRRCS